MQIAISYTTQIAVAAGVTSENCTLPDGTTVGQLIEYLVKMRGDELRANLLDEGGRLLPAVLVSVNDVQIIDPESHELHDSDDVLLMSAVSGG